MLVIRERVGESERARDGVLLNGVVQLVTAVLKLLPLLVVALAGLALGDAGAVPATNPTDAPLPLMLTAVHQERLSLERIWLTLLSLLPAIPTARQPWR